MSGLLRQFLTTLKKHKLVKSSVIIIMILVLAAGFSESTVQAFTSSQNSQKNPLSLSNSLLEAEITQSILNQHITTDGAGWAYESQIQYPNEQVDRDVGDASVGMGLLDAYNANKTDLAALNGAKQIATWLMGKAVVTTNGMYWHDYYDEKSTSSDVYTSFDDGSIGIGDYFWRLYEVTGNPAYKQVAYQTLDWTFSQAINIGKNGMTEYHWNWDVNPSDTPDYEDGMGEGVIGIIEALTTYYQRFNSAQYSDPAMAAKVLKYLNGSLNYLKAAQVELGVELGNNTYARTVPEADPFLSNDANTAMDSGYLWGAAGLAFMYLKLYQVFPHDTNYLTRAEAAFTWLEDSKYGPIVRYKDGSVSFKLSIDPQDKNDNSYATGIEEGNAGIGWVYLQAYEITHNTHYLAMAESCAKWLLDVAVKSKNGGLSWHEDMHPTNTLIHTNLDNGTAGIGMFLEDLYKVTGSSKYKNAVNGALISIKSTAKYKSGNIYWTDNGGYANGNSGPSSPYSDDPSWHWGNAGILSFVIRVNGGSWDIPGEESGLFAPN